ncbi:YifB family Mg chelatase-like AAA ATPase [Nocardioides nanhaiensis]|uniref:YifB family Mg chelatase-like AAA ATPase n=1 Tax=Nocardioides nanhaiensis TaxID=1476871 RepID=A0ABP8WVU0_9ACTN
MPHATTSTVALTGALGHHIDVQADVSPGSVSTTLIGRPDASLMEAKDRCRMAIINSGLAWPATKRTTILLSPADLHKRGTHYDLAICVAILAADAQVPPETLPGTTFIGELGLDGGLRCVPGVLPMVLAAVERGARRVFVPEPLAAEAAMVEGLEVLGLRSLEQVVAELRGDLVPGAPPVPPMASSRLLAWRGDERLEELDLADLRGMPDTRLAVEVAAAGGHHLLLSGPKGSGKTSIAERIPTILPPLSREESLELTAIHSLAGILDPAHGMLTQAPWSAPHHDASKASLVGGGSGRVTPGELSRAHGGVLFLDEFPLFRVDAIEALRQPMESGEVTIARMGESATLPARGMVVLACNPCPCGDYTEKAGSNRCTCRETTRRDYRRKLSGPIVDRVDVVRHVAPLAPHQEFDRFDVGEPSSVVRERVALVRLRQAERYQGCAWRLNAHVPGAVLRERWPLEQSAQSLVDEDVYQGRLTRRGAVRVQRVAWTLADLAAVRSGLPGSEQHQPGGDEVEVALALRHGAPLPSRALHLEAS